MTPIIQTALHDFSHRDQLGDFLNRAGLTGKGVEVGTLYGAYAEIILRTWKGHLYCVDPWRNQPKEIYFDGANLADMEAIWKTVNSILGKHPRCSLVRAMSLNAVGKFDDGELDFVYLDGNHSLESVRADLLAWWPKIRVGGLMCGHDFNVRYDRETNSDALTAVAELLEIIGVRVHVTWETSWWIIKTKEADEAFRAANLDGRLAPPVYSDNRGAELVVVMPVAKFDWNLAKKNLRWIERLADMDPGASKFDLVVYATPALTDGQREELDTSGRVVVAEGLKEIGYFGVPNQLIRGALEYCEKHHPGKAMLWLEADAVLLRPTSVCEIRDEYRACGRPFLGAFFREIEWAPHMSGNAVYHPNWRTCAPSLARLTTEECGWDSLCAFETMPRGWPSRTIQQIWRPPLPITDAWAKANIRPEAALFHQCKDGSLIDVLCRRAGLPLIPLDAPLCESTYATQQHGEIDPVKVIGPPVGLQKSSFAIQPRRIIPAPTPARPPPPPAPGTAGLAVEILIVTFKRDMDFLRFCLKSITQYARGFTGVTLVVPSTEKGLYSWVSSAVKVRYFDEAPGKGMLHHMLQSCRADEWCPNAGAVLHLDPDCVFWHAVTPEDYVRGGQPLIVRERYAEVGKRNVNRLAWQKCVEAATGLDPEWETMVRHPQVHLRAVYARLRQLVEQHTGRKFDEFVLDGHDAFPQSFCEFNSLGAVAIKEFAASYHFVDYDHDGDARECGVADGTQFQYIYRRDRDRLVETWSHGGINDYKDFLEGVLHGRVPAYYVK